MEFRYSNNEFFIQWAWHDSHKIAIIVFGRKDDFNLLFLY